MRWQGRRESDNVEDRRGEGGGFGGGFPGGGLGGPRLPMGLPGGRGGMSLGGIGVVLVILAVAWFAGIDPSTLLGGGQGSGSMQFPGASGGKAGTPADEQGKFVAAVLADTEDHWHKVFQDGGRTYEDPTLVLFSGQTQSGCGSATAATGPFYCPNDHKLYIDLAFYDELSTRFGAPGDFAEAYVIAHEVGHHVQNLLGILPKVDAQRRQASETEANELSVRLELQADCFSGVWAHAAEQEGILEVGDIDEALNAAAAVGDDRLQKQGQGYVVPDSFTHGTSEQRSRWFKRGYADGSTNSCDTFGASQL